MSSHHIIRENQEPALLIDDLNAVPLPYFEQLLEWSPTILTGDDALIQLQAHGIKVDVWFTRKKEATPPPQDHLLIIPAGPAWMDTALDHLIARGHRAVNVLSETSSVLELMYRYADRIDIVLLGNEQRIVVAKPGLNKWKPAGETIWLYGESNGVVTEGLIRRGANEYVTQQDGFFSVTFSGSYGLVGERL
ncbi:thiamine diphosphokinase [Parapedobacter lycopersici]|uniref:thiamine diphosphokinase n=1 Tax=Parapedobacter lycopersici TaxID=1864939 RepID=UPI00214D774B|nr:thiamine diphosphokinase [Parapedobacter lycopersici]